jgi:hypothetical protein
VIPIGFNGKNRKKMGSIFYMYSSFGNAPPQTVEENINWVTCHPIPLKRLEEVFVEAWGKGN